MRIYLEITNNCNKSCEFCAKSQREKGFLPLQLVRSRIEKIKDFADEVYLHVLGEPLLHKEILKIFSILQEQQVFFKITTNGTLLNDEKITKLLANPYFKQINFSLHALTESEIHGEILERVLEFSKKLMVERNDVFVNYRLWNYTTADEIKNAFILAKIADFFQLEPIKIPENRRSKRLLDRIYLNIDKRFEWPNSLPDKKLDTGTIVKGFCHGGSSQLGVLLDGTIVPCCLDSEGEINLGNIDKIDNFQEILNSARLQNICANFNTGKVIEPFCQKCTFRKRFFADN